MAGPTVSVIMSALNAERTIELAIRSIVQQTMADWELIIMDDGSRDGTRRLVQAFADPRIKLVAHDQRKGLATRLNEGVALAKGAFIARMDADDVAYPERFERQLGFLRAHPQVDLVGSAVLAFKDPWTAVGVSRVSEEHAQICAHPERGFDVAHPTWFGRCEFFRTFRYDEGAMRAQDQDLLLRAHRHARFANVPEVLLGYRLESVTARNTARGRLQYCRSVVRTWGAEGAYGQIVRGVLTQGLRAAVAVPLIALGLGDRVARRRFSAVEDAELQRWQRLKGMLST